MYLQFRSCIYELMTCNLFYYVGNHHKKKKNKGNTFTQCNYTAMIENLAVRKSLLLQILLCFQLKFFIKYLSMHQFQIGPDKICETVTAKNLLD